MPVSWDAIILTGGRGIRLDGADKAGLVGPDGRTCLERTIDACSDAESRVVVGPECDDPRVFSTREVPPYSGPARAILAGLAGLAGLAVLPCGARIGVQTPQKPRFTPRPFPPGRESGMTPVESPDSRPAETQWVVAVACDIPRVGEAIPLLLDAAESVSTDVDGVVAFTDGHPQWLCAAYRRSSLASACARLPEHGADESVRSLVSNLTLSEIPIPEAIAHDIDTPADLRALGFHQPVCHGDGSSVCHGDGSSVTACQTGNSSVFHNKSSSMYRKP